MYDKLQFPRFSSFILLISILILTNCQRQTESQPTGLQAELAPKTGLHVQLGDIPVIRSSNMRFMATNFSKVFYDFSWVYQPVAPAEKGSTELLLGGPNSFINGRFSMQSADNAIDLRLSGKWQRADSAMLDAQVGRIWLPAFAGGSLILEGSKPQTLAIDADGFLPEPVNLDSFTRLTLKADIGALTFELPEGEGMANSSSKRQPEAQRWSSAPPSLQVHLRTFAIAPGSDFEKKVSIRFTPGRSAGPGQTASLDLPQQAIEAVWRVQDERLPLIPHPKSIEVNIASELALAPKSQGPLSSFDSLLANAIRRLWDYPFTGFSNIATKPSMSELPAEGFDIDINDKVITVGWRDAVGMRHAANALAFLIRVKDGQLLLPRGSVRDYPSGTWRGIHMFVGPQALAFHRHMYDRILIPMRMNKVVLQCEQTDWSSQPGIRNPITMPLKDLGAEAAFLRAQGIEFIPLIQSFGHMEWFFVNNQNLDLATNPEIPYTIDVRKARSREALHAIWDEVVAVTGATTLHFGLDEVDMIGWPKRDPELITQLWQEHMPFLTGIAKKHKAEVMVWGDMLLGPGESIDFSNAETAEQARLRRATLPKGAYVADWHYKGDPKPENYAPSLDVLTAAGLRPIASTWFYPNNIRGFNLAAVNRGMGTLQTTWADYESCEANMLKYLSQFGAYILSLDYAWSARKELPEELSYDPNELWARLYYRIPQPVRDKPGTLTGDAKAPLITCGPLQFRQLAASGGEVSLKTSASASAVALLMRTGCFAEENELLARAECHFKDGTVKTQDIRYGVHLRSKADTRPVLAGYRDADSRCAYLLPFDKVSNLERIVIKPANSYGRVALEGVTLID